MSSWKKTKSYHCEQVRFRFIISRPIHLVVKPQQLIVKLPGRFQLSKLSKVWFELRSWVNTVFVAQLVIIYLPFRYYINENSFNDKFSLTSWVTRNTGFRLGMRQKIKREIRPNVNQLFFASPILELLFKLKVAGP